jgi:hypothetical protein
VAHIAEPVKGYSYDVVQTWKRAIDVLFIDASHDYEAVHRDFQLWSPFVKVGGIVAMHDVSPVWPGPSRVMAEYLQPPEYCDLQQVDSLAWVTKTRMEESSVPLAPRTVINTTKVDFYARLSELERLFRACADHAQTSESLMAQLTASREQNAQLESEVARLAKQVDDQASEARRLLRAQDSTITRLAKQVDDQGSEARRLLRAQDSTITHATNCLQEAHHELDALRRSWSWRITAPLRGLVDLGSTGRRLLLGRRRDSWRGKILK